MMKRLLLPVVLLFATALPSFAQFAVIDHANLQNAILRHAALVRQLQQLQRTYLVTMQQYQLLRFEAQQARNMARYRGNFSAWQLLNAANTYGNTGQWVLGANGGIVPDIRAGYGQLTAALTPYVKPQKSQTEQQQSYGLVQLRDGANLTSLDTLAGIRSKDRALDRQIGQLQADSLSANPGLNTQVAVLNRINASNLLMLRSLQETNKLLVSLLEQKTLDATDERNHSARAIDTSVTAYQTYMQNARALGGGHNGGGLLP